jgi:transposase
MAIAVQQIRPLAHLPLVLGVLRRLEVATVVDGLIPPHREHVLATGRGVEALVLAILDGDHALYKVGQRLDERGMLDLLQPGLPRASLHDYRLGHILDALFATNLNKVFSAIALKALKVYAIPTPWLHQDTTTIALYGAYADEATTPRAPRPAYGHSKDGRDDLKQVLLSLGVSGDGGIPLRLGVRDGNRSDSVETPVAIEECLALGLEGMRGIVADSKAYSRRTLGVCLEHGIDLVTLVPRTCAIRPELEAWGRQQPALPLLVEKPGRTQDEAPRHWHGQSVLRHVEVEYRDGRVAQHELRFVVVHSSQLAQQQTHTYASAQEKEAQAVADHRQRVQARWFACVPDAAAAIAEYEGRGQGRRGRRPRPWRYHTVCYRIVAETRRTHRARSGATREDRAAPDRVGLSSRDGGRNPAQPGGGQWLDGARHYRQSRDRDRCGDSPGLSGAAYDRGTGLSLDQEPGGYRPRVARETRTDCRLSDAHGRRLAGLQHYPAAGPPLSPHTSPAGTWEQRHDSDTDGGRSAGLVCPRGSDPIRRR